MSIGIALSLDCVLMAASGVCMPSQKQGGPTDCAKKSATIVAAILVTILTVLVCAVLCFLGMALGVRMTLYFVVACCMIALSDQEGRRVAVQLWTRFTEKTEF
jgi:hypothetical protein